MAREKRLKLESGALYGKMTREDGLKERSDAEIIRHRKNEFGVKAYKEWCNDWNETRALVMKYLPVGKSIPIVPKKEGE